MEIVHDHVAAPELRVYRREADGAVMVEGDPLAEGVMDYGGVRELITPEAVQAYRDHIANLTITMGHPSSDVTPDNVADLGVGNVDGAPEIVTRPGGWTAIRASHILRRRDAVSAAEAHLAGGPRLTGLSLGHVPVRDAQSGTHPIFGHYDRRRIGCVLVNHVALCGATDALPPPRGKNCGLYLDSMPATPAEDSMKKKPTIDSAEAKALIARVFPTRDGKVQDAPSLEELASIVQEAMKDPESLAALVVHAIVNKPAEVAEIKSGEEPLDGGMSEEKMGAMMDAKIAPLKAQLDALIAEKATRDAAAQTAEDAALREHGAFFGVKDAATAPIASVVAGLASRLAIATDSREIVAKTAALRRTMTGSRVTVSANDAADTIPAEIGV